MLPQRFPASFSGLRILNAARTSEPAHPGLGITSTESSSFLSYPCKQYEYLVLPLSEILEVLWETLPGSNLPHSETVVFVVMSLKV